MNQVIINAWNVHNGEERNYGPYEWVQFTYNILRVPEDVTIAHLDTNVDDDVDFWLFEEDMFIATDFTIAPAK